MTLAPARPLIAAAIAAAALPSLLAFNPPPSPTFLNQALAIAAWGVFAGMAGGRLRDGDATSPSVLKLIGSELHQRVAELAMEIAGTARGIALEPFRDEDGQLADGARATAKHFATRAASIYSGSSETQRNVIAQALSPTTR